MNSHSPLTKKEKLFFILYLLFFFVTALVLAFFQPADNNPPLFSNPPDEHARILIPEFIALNGYLPTGLEDEVIIPGYGFSYGLTPYLPFVIMGYAMRIVYLLGGSALSLIYTARFVNVCFGTVMAAVVFFLGRRIFSNKKYAMAFSVSVMFLPEHLFVHSYVNTESMCFLGIAILLLGLVSLYQGGANIKNTLTIATGLSIIISSYYNAYGYIVSAFLLFIVYFINFTSSEKEGAGKKLSIDHKSMFKYGFMIFGIVFATSGWWFIRNIILFNGVIFGMRTRDALFHAANPESWNSYRNSGYTIMEMLKLNPDYFPVVLKTFFASLGSVSIFCNDFYYIIYELIYLTGLILSLSFAISSIVKRKCGASGFKSVFFHINMLFCILMPAFLHMYYVYVVEFQRQGRYLLPMLIPLVYYVIKGYERLENKKFKNSALNQLIKAVPCIITIWVFIAIVWMVFKVALPVYLSDPVWNHIPPSQIFE